MVKNLEQNDCFFFLFFSPSCFPVLLVLIAFLSLAVPSPYLCHPKLHPFTIQILHVLSYAVSIADGFRKFKKVVFYVKDKFLYTETIKLYCVVVLYRNCSLEVLFTPFSPYLCGADFGQPGHVADR